MRHLNLKRVWPMGAKLPGRWMMALCLLGTMLFTRENLQAEATVTTIGGGSTSQPYSGYVDGDTLTTAKFAMPMGMALDPSGTVLFVADYTNSAVRMISQVGDTATSVTSTFANATNNGGIAGIDHPVAVTVDAATNVYVLNRGNGTNGAVLHLSGLYLNDGLVLVYPKLATGLVNATAMAMDGYDNLYVVVNSNRVIRVTSNQVVTTVGTISQAGTSLKGIAVLDNGVLALTDAGNNGIWLMNPGNGASAKFTGFHGNGDTNGPAEFASFNAPAMIAKAGGGMLVVADRGNHKVKLVDQSGTVSLLYGVSSNLWVTGTGQFPGWYDGPGSPVQGSAESRDPYGVLVAADGSVYVTETYYHVLRHVTGAGLTAPQPGYPPTFSGPAGIAYDSTDNYLFMANYNDNSVQLLDLGDNLTSTFLTAADGLQNPISVLVDDSDNLYVLNQGTLGKGFIQEFDIFGNNYGPIVTGLNVPTAFTLDGYGNFIVAEQSGNIRAIGPTVSTTVATITNANVSLQGIALFDDGNIAVSDSGNDVIWAVDPITKAITRLTGQLGVPGTAVGTNRFAQLNQPHQLARVANDQIIAADTGNNRLVLVQRTGTVITNSSTYHLNSSTANIWFGNDNDPVASGSPSFVPMVDPYGVAIGGSGDVYASEDYYNDIRGLTATGVASASSNPGVPLPLYSNPAGIALNNEGTVLYVTDPTNNTVSALNLSSDQTTTFLDTSSGLSQPVDVASDSSDNVYVLNQGTGNNGSVVEFDQYGNYIGTLASSLAMPTAMKMSFTGDIYVSELNGAVQEFNTSGSNTLANISTNANVRLEGIALLDNGSVVVSDAGNNVVWKIAPGATNAVLLTGVIGTSGTNFGAVGSAKLNKPMRLAQAFGGLLLIADSGNNRVVVADDSGSISKAIVTTNATLWYGLPIDPVKPGSPNYVPMLAPGGLAIGSVSSTNGIVYTSENVYKDIRGTTTPGITPPIPPPPAPLNVVATVTYGQVTLTWSASTGATSYDVKHSSSPGGPFTQIASTTSTTYTDNELGGSTNYYVISAVNAGGEGQPSSQVLAVPLIPPPPAPRIGWFDYEGNDLNGFFTVLHPVTVATFNNDQLLAIDPGTNGVSTYYTIDGSEPSATNGSTPPFYQDGLGYAQPLPASTVPDLIIKSINMDSIGQLSPITTAEFKFQVANPVITGNNGAQFTVSDITSNAVYWYTVDGTDPTNASPSIGPVYSDTNGDPVSLSIAVTTNVVFKVRAFRNGYQSSGIAVASFSTANFQPTKITFGTASGEPHSRFLARPGQFYYAPVTLQLNASVKQMYSLQFNVTVTNGFTNILNGQAIPPVVNGEGMDFFSMLMSQVVPAEGLYYPPADGNWYLTIPPLTEAYTAAITNLSSTVIVNTNNNLLGVGWIYRTGYKYGYTDTEGNIILDYDTTKQDLIKYSIAHDTLFAQANGLIVAGAYSFRVPSNAVAGDQYFIQLGSPSATSDGVGAPGSSIYIQPPAQSQAITVASPAYLVGDAAPFHWLNAGDFGDTNLDNADVMQIYQSGVLGDDMPPTNSDLFAAMDSSGGFGTYDKADGYFTNSGPANAVEQLAMWNANDQTINSNAFGDGVLDVNDLYVTFRRSLDPSLMWFERYWTNGMFVAVPAPNYAYNSNTPHLYKSNSGTVANAANSSTPAYANSSVVFDAGDAVGSAGTTVKIPITANVLGSYPLRVLALNITVHPLDGSPDISNTVSFAQSSALGLPEIAPGSKFPGNFNAAWLNSTIAGLSNNATIGTLSVTLPPTATASSAYAVHFDFASGSPNGLAVFPKTMYTGLITTTSRTNSSFGDGIPDSWRLRWFGTVNNALSASNACPSGDGVPNWKKYVAGVDPNVANDFPSVNSKTPSTTGATTAIHWPSVLGKQYVIMRSSSLFNGPWSVLSTNTGTGGDMEFDDTNTDSVKFYRVEILP